MKANKGLIVFVFLVIHPFYAARAKKKKKKIVSDFFFFKYVRNLGVLDPVGTRPPYIWRTKMVF